ncbi:MAG TPA: hypothetical protein IAA51_10735 [Candidatus Cottocaccamicrobium excrementipullorum]|nr:hypothetical protein [Candidatus Cottocaccamicrobium excrementipullorum]
MGDSSFDYIVSFAIIAYAIIVCAFVAGVKTIHEVFWREDIVDKPGRECYNAGDLWEEYGKTIGRRKEGNADEKLISRMYF